MCTCCGFDHFDARGLPAGHVIYLNRIATRQCYHDQFVARQTKNVCGNRPRLDPPFDRLLAQVQCHQLVAVLHGGVNGGAFTVDPQMTGRFAGGHSPGQHRTAAVLAVDINVVESVSGRDKPFHVR